MANTPSVSEEGSSWSADTNESIIRKFLKRVQSEGLLAEMKKKERYRKPSELRKEARVTLRRRLYRRRTSE